MHQRSFPALPCAGLAVGHSTRRFTYSRGKDLRTVDGIIVGGRS